MSIRVPASSANLGPGFDALGMALTLYATVGVVGADDPVDGAHVVDEFHPASIAFRALGGVGELWVHAPIPAGRGLGFSGTVRVAGAAAAVAQRAGFGGAFSADDRSEVFAATAALEGHGDNVSASVYGGITATAAGHCITVACPLDFTVVVWIPSYTTSTDQSRRQLASTVPLADAAFNIGHTALLVAAFAAGDVAGLRLAVQDRLHQPTRLASIPESQRALDAMVEAGAWCAWLSGSGPTVAALCAVADQEAVAAAAPSGGHTKMLALDTVGLTVV